MAHLTLFPAPNTLDPTILLINKPYLSQSACVKAEKTPKCAEQGVFQDQESFSTVSKANILISLWFIFAIKYFRSYITQIMTAEKNLFFVDCVPSISALVAYTLTEQVN